MYIVNDKLILIIIVKWVHEIFLRSYMLTSIDVKVFKFKFLIRKEVQILKRFKFEKNFKY